MTAQVTSVRGGVPEFVAGALYVGIYYGVSGWIKRDG